MELVKNYAVVAIWLLSASTLFAQTQAIVNAAGSSSKPAQYDAFFGQLMDTLNMPGLSVAIINDAAVVYHKTFGSKIAATDEKIAPTTFFEAASLSKPLFAFFVMKQVEKGVLDLDKPLYQYLPYPDIEYDERYKQITARMVLSHTSGLPNWRTDSLKIDFAPGSRFQYSGEGYRYLADVIATANSISIEALDSLFQVEVAQPLGAKLHYKWKAEIAEDKATGHLNDQATDNNEVRPDLHFGAAGGLYTEAYNYAKFITTLMQEDLLSPALYKELFKAQIQLPEDDINKIILHASAWSLGFGMIPTDYGTCYWHSGNNQDYQSWFHFFPEQKYGIVLFTNSDKIQNPDFFMRFFSFIKDGLVFDMSKL